jgi:hypothetical protein
MADQHSTNLDPVQYDVPFGVNEMRLSAAHWLAALTIVIACLLATPRVWKKIERFDTGVDYRIPYALSKDYWLYERRLEQISAPSKVIILGDSVVWGEYVQPNGTLSHFLSNQTGSPGSFVNCGVNGLFPLAMEGLVTHFGHTLHNRKIILHANLLWMSSPKADLSIEREEPFNHSRLVPQFWPRISCYRADANERLSVVIEEHVSFPAWVGHLQNVYYDNRSIPNWTLADDGSGDPPNTWRSPLAPMTLIVPPEPNDDPLRGPRSPRHKSWTADGGAPTNFDWVPLESSLQWQALQRTIPLLRNRGNDVLVIVGPFNEHMIAEDQRPTYRALRDGVTAWLNQNQVAHVIPEMLPSELYADASHPLTDGYKLLAKRISQHETFRIWLQNGLISNSPSR